MPFTTEQLDRYSRQMLLDEIGEEGQTKLANAKVLIIGAGGLGSPSAMYLAAAGVGTIGIADADDVDLSNMQRQIIHRMSNLGKAKVDSAAETVKSINPDVQVKTYKVFLSEDNISDIIRDYDFVIDATDNFESKFLINDACVSEKKAFSHAGINGFKGQLMTYVPDQGPCYRCIFKNPPEVNTENTQNAENIKATEKTGSQETSTKTDSPAKERKKLGVVGACAGTIGSLQAMEAIKYIVGAGNLLTGRLLTYDGLKMEFHTVKLPEKVESCPACGKK